MPNVRITLDLPDDLSLAIESLAGRSGSSLNGTIIDLIVLGLGDHMPPFGSGRLTISPITGLPLVKSRRRITPEDVKALEDD
jgi:hypothetical protein